MRSVRSTSMVKLLANAMKSVPGLNSGSTNAPASPTSAQRSGDQQRPTEELDYLERLLKRF